MGKFFPKGDAVIIYGTQEEMNSQPVRDLLAENARLRAELDAHTPNPSFTIDDLRKEVERLRAENEALKPKPDIEEMELFAWFQHIDDGGCPIPHTDPYADNPNVRLTFHDGKLVKAEVIG